MRLGTVGFAASTFLATTGFTDAYAQTTAVSEHSFDWIFFAIVGIPFVIALAGIFRADIFESMILGRRDRTTGR